LAFANVAQELPDNTLLMVILQEKPAEAGNDNDNGERCYGSGYESIPLFLASSVMVEIARHAAPSLLCQQAYFAGLALL
ncbi:MAG: hypothetical protein KGN84_13730, partial [Acidobacteriota bacterium]|nr:hypothetical protein [Acidobacteriota bacterium]